MANREHQGFIDGLNHGVGVLQAGLDELERKSFSEIYQSKDTGKESSQLIKIIGLAERKLRKVVRAVPTKEREVQDAFESLLVGAEIQYTREGPHIEYSSKNYIPDFSFDRIDLALEIKLCVRPGREKEMIAEINDDIMAYKTKFGNLGFVIYDVGLIRDTDKFADQFSRDDIFIAVIKH
ncbi:hypothetical protein GCM10007100_31540 [Roseibacillus persicicus]|uniref:Uncharacterized protein n=2 Tax=Roseibacillus persicicus TaxID=454148 RepID=A0A918WPE3_9BACT|nr:hypothetical protein GCM10007100_31540 [Roseibacillus persicicus]